jgi:Tfp pilus assembly PilM family ATPase
MFGARQRKATGIHIADRVLHIVELTRRRGDLRLTGLVQETLPFACSPARLAGQERGELARFIRRVGQERGLAYANPALALGAHAFLLKRRAWIRGSEELNRDHLRWEAQQVLPDRLSEYLLDFARTPRGYFLVAARKRALRQYRALCRKSGLKRPLFDVGPFALYNAMESSGKLAAEAAELLVDISPPEALVLLLDAGELQAVGACNWEGESPQARREALAERVQQLVESESSQKPGRLWLSGSGAGDPEWGALLRERIAAPQELFDPLSGVDLELAEEGITPAIRAACAVAAGLAFRRLSEDD